MRSGKVIGIFLVLLLLAGLSFFFLKNAPPQNEIQKVTVSQAFQHLLYIGLYVAKDAGFFAGEGLDVTITTAGGDAQAFAALTGGKADFAQGDPAFVAISSEKGWDGKVIVMAVDRAAIWGVTFDTSIQPFTTPAGFKGKKIATYPDPNTSYVIQEQLARQAGLTLGKDVFIQQVPFGSELATLKRRVVDIAQTIEPNVTQVELQGGRTVFSYPDAWGPLAFTGVMVSQKMIDDNPATVQKFVSAYEHALKYIQTNFDSTVQIARKYLPDLPEQVVRVALKRLVASGCIPPHAEVNPLSWDRLLKIRIEVGDLKSIPAKSLIDNSFAERALHSYK